MRLRTAPVRIPSSARRGVDNGEPDSGAAGDNRRRGDPDSTDTDPAGAVDEDGTDDGDWEDDKEGTKIVVEKEEEEKRGGAVVENIFRLYRRCKRSLAPTSLPSDSTSAIPEIAPNQGPRGGQKRGRGQS